MPEAETIVTEPDESTADEKKSPAERLPELLAEFDEHKRPVREPEGLSADALDNRTDEIKDFESRISELETENGTLSERAEKAEETAKFVDESLARIDKHDLSRAADRITKETSLTQAAAEREIELRFYEDEAFANAADGRFDSPENFESALEGIVDDLADKYPQREDHRSLAHAYRIARSAHGGAGSYDEGRYPDLSKLNDHQFAAASEQIFEDMRSGKLRPEGNSRGGGCLSTSPPGTFK